MRLVVVGAAVLVALSGCEFYPSGPIEGQAASARDDAAADFAGGQLESARIEPWGAIAPAAYATGGLLAGFSNDRRFVDATDATWDQVVAGGTSGTSVWTGRHFGDPIGVGHQPATGDWTYWAEGEIWLTAGATELVLVADDEGFVEIATDGVTWSRIAEAAWPSGDRGDAIVAADGWYPIRLAVQQGPGDAELRLETPDAFQGLIIVPRHRLRARVDGLRGLLLTGFDQDYFRVPGGVTLDTTLLADRDFGSGMPADLGIFDGNEWSVRWAGQLYAPAAGNYHLRYQSDNAQRLYLGGERRLAAWPSTDVLDREVAVALAAGWNDLVIDLNEDSGAAQARVAIVGAPDGVTGPLPLDRLRPLEPRSERLSVTTESSAVSIPNGATTGVDAVLQLDALEGTTITRLDLEVSLNHGDLADLELRLYHPRGHELVLLNHTASGSGPQTLRFFDSDAFAGMPAAGRYVVRISDTRGGPSGTRTNVVLTVHARGGPDQIARAATFTSRVRDLGPYVLAIDAVRLGARTPAGATAVVRARTCDQAEACAARSWSGPIADGADPRLTAQRFIQYRVELSSDGEREAEVDWVEIEYHHR